MIEKNSTIKFALLLLPFCALISCGGQNGTTFTRNPTNVVQSDDISLEVYDFENFRPFLNRENDTVYAINFWATWCAPCVKELPHFEQIGEEYREKPLKVLLVSLDFPDKIISQVIPFIRKRNLQSEVILLDAPDANAWIPEIDPSWTGAIPATVIYKKKERGFYERSFTLDELKAEIEKF